MSLNLLDAQSLINGLLNQYNPGGGTTPLGQAQGIGSGGVYGPKTSGSPYPVYGPATRNPVEIIPSSEYDRLKKVDKEYIELLELLNIFIQEYMRTDFDTLEEHQVMKDFENNLTEFMKRTTNGKK